MAACQLVCALSNSHTLERGIVFIKGVRLDALSEQWVKIISVLWGSVNQKDVLSKVRICYLIGCLIGLFNHKET